MTEKIIKGPELTLKPPNSSIGQFFFESAEKYGDRTFQIDATTGHRETFASIKRRSTSIAIQMQKRGVTSNDVVLMCTPTTLDAPVPIIASCYLGAKIGNLDPSLSARQVTYLLSLVRPKIIFVDENSVPLIEESKEKAELEVQIVVFGTSTKYPTFSSFDTIQENQNQFRPTALDIDETAILFFSSGTTGLPKAICHSSSSFLHLAFCFFQTSSTSLDVTLSFSSFYWITAVLFLTCTFVKGGHRVVCGNNVEAEKTFGAIEKYKITYMFLAPILTYKMTSFENWREYDTSSLHVLMTTGTPLSHSQYSKLCDIFQKTHVIGCYGQTETGVISLFDPLTDAHLVLKKSSSSGKVITGITLKIVDIESGNSLGQNGKGEICVKSSSVMKGYYNSESTDLLDDDGFLKTGDVGYYDEDGCLYIVERVKEMFKYMSWHIVPSAIEQVLLEHPSIKEAVVFGYPRNEEEGEVPAAAVVFREGFHSSEREIDEFVAARVSDREKLRGGVFILDALQRTATGKLMRREIRKSIIGTNNN